MNNLLNVGGGNAARLGATELDESQAGTRMVKRRKQWPGRRIVGMKTSMDGGDGGATKELKFEAELIAPGDLGPGGDRGDAQTELAPRLVLAEQDQGLAARVGLDGDRRS